MDEEKNKKQYQQLQTTPQGVNIKKTVNSLDIVPIKTNKNLIYKKPIMKKFIIPSHPSSAIFFVFSGSGKSTLLLNLLTRPEFYGPQTEDDKSTAYFEEIILFAPTARSDDMFQKLIDLYHLNVLASWHLPHQSKLLLEH